MMLTIIAVLNLVGIVALIYQIYRFRKISLYYSESADDYILKLYDVIDKNFKKEAEILNTLTEWRNKYE